MHVRQRVSEFYGRGVRSRRGDERAHQRRRYRRKALLRSRSSEFARVVSVCVCTSVANIQGAISLDLTGGRRRISEVTLGEP